MTFSSSLSENGDLLVISMQNLGNIIKIQLRFNIIMHPISYFSYFNFKLSKYNSHVFLGHILIKINNIIIFQYINIQRAC